jgi:hypothetical protein
MVKSYNDDIFLHDLFEPSPGAGWGKIASPPEQPRTTETDHGEQRRLSSPDP